MVRREGMDSRTTGRAHRRSPGSAVARLPVEHPEKPSRGASDSDAEEQVHLRVAVGQQPQVVAESHGIVERHDDEPKPNPEPPCDAMPAWPDNQTRPIRRIAGERFKVRPGITRENYNKKIIKLEKK